MVLWSLKVQAKVGNTTYMLQLPDHARIHPVFHVSQLKKAIAATEPSQQLPEFLSADWELQVNNTISKKEKRAVEIFLIEK